MSPNVMGPFHVYLKRQHKITRPHIGLRIASHANARLERQIGQIGQICMAMVLFVKVMQYRCFLDTRYQLTNTIAIDVIIWT